MKLSKTILGLSALLAFFDISISALGTGVESTGESFKSPRRWAYQKSSPTDDIFGTEFPENAKDILSGLQMQKEYYETLLEQDENDKSKVESLLEATTEMISYVQQNESSINEHQLGISTLDYGPTDYTSATLVILEGIAYFNTCNYKLAAELLTHSWGMSFTDGAYYPIHGSEVLSSNLTYDIADGKEQSGSGAFNMTFGPGNESSRNQEDLFFSIHNFDFSKPSKTSKIVTFTDIYDFAYSGYDSGIIGMLTNAFAYAQSVGIVRNYEVKITIDTTVPLKLSYLGQASDGSYTINVENRSDTGRVVFYNSKLAFWGDASTWANLSDIEILGDSSQANEKELNVYSLPAHESQNIQITGTGTASTVAVSYIDGNQRIVSYADELGDKHNINLETATVSFSQTPELKNYGKNGNNWLIGIKNTFGETAIIYYNTKMCFAGDAEKWTGLSDVELLTLSPMQEKVVRIGENYAATSIAVRFETSDHTYYYAGTELGEDCSMTVSSHSKIKYTYLSLDIVSKSGSTWKIRIRNPLNRAVTVQYNSKMCNLGDAENWTGLSDIQSVSISGFSSTTVEISENWFATSITCSYVSDGVRLITYANQLNTNGTLNVMQNYINI